MLAKPSSGMVDSGERAAISQSISSHKVQGSGSAAKAS